MRLYHGTSEGNYRKIKKSGVLKGRPLCLAVTRDYAKQHGEVLLEVDFQPNVQEMKDYGDTMKFMSNPTNFGPFQVETHKEISLENVRRIK